ncbi:MAG: C-terminal helicase domain-containing protein [Propionicimonas sp.]
MKDLIIRRHRHSPEVAAVVGADWAERKEPNNILAPASGIENEIATELNDVWLHPRSGKSPYSGNNTSLFPWTLAKAFLSSPAALLESIKNRLARITDGREAEALTRLKDLAERAVEGRSAKYDALVDLLEKVGIGAGSPERAVIFAERVPTLHWLAKRLVKSFRLPAGAVEVLHGQLSDELQQKIVESFKQESSPIRLLVTGDVASEGVNLHLQCHELVHFDVPWSLIRIEQRNGRIDRYGQKHNPRITTLLLDPEGTEFAGDIRVLQRLMEREHEAHRALGDVSSLMGKYDTDAEEDAIRRVLARQQAFEDVVSDVSNVTDSDSFGGFFERIVAASNAAKAPAATDSARGVFPDDISFLRDALVEVFTTPQLTQPNGVSWQDHSQHQLAELQPPKDLVARLSVLPQSYLSDRRVTDKLMLATTTQRGEQDLASARSAVSTSLWPESHFLAPLHPVLDWISDRALASLSRNEIFVVRGEGDGAQVLIHGSLTNKRGQVVAAAFIVVAFPEIFQTGDPLHHGCRRHRWRA